MSKFSNIWKPTPKKAEQFLLGLKALIAGLALSAMAQADAKLGFWLLAAGGVIDLVIRMFFNSTDGSDKTE